MKEKQPSNAVKNSVVVGTPAAVIGGYLAAEASRKWGVPIEVAGSAIMLVGSWISSAIAFFSRGGKKGEAD